MAKKVTGYIKLQIPAAKAWKSRLLLKKKNVLLQWINSHFGLIQT